MGVRNNDATHQELVQIRALELGNDWRVRFELFFDDLVPVMVEQRVVNVQHQTPSAFRLFSRQVHDFNLGLEID